MTMLFLILWAGWARLSSSSLRVRVAAPAIIRELSWARMPTVTHTRAWPGGDGMAGRMGSAGAEGPLHVDSGHRPLHVASPCSLSSEVTGLLAHGAQQ